MTLLVGLVVIAVAIWAIVRRIDVRLVLLVAALALGCLAGHPDVIVRKFLTTLVNEQFVIPIGCSLGFVYVLRQTGCDQHLVHLLIRPIQADYQYMQLPNNSTNQQHNFRLAAGVVFR